MAATLAPVPPVDDRITTMRDALHNNQEAQAYFPGLEKLLSNYLDASSFNAKDDSVDKEQFTRGLLRCFYKTQKDDTYSKVLATYSPAEQEKIKAFVEDKEPAEKIGKNFAVQPSPPLREEVDALKAAPQPEVAKDTVEGGPILHEDPEKVTHEGHGIWNWFKTQFFGDSKQKEGVLVVSRQPVHTRGSISRLICQSPTQIWSSTIGATPSKTDQNSPTCLAVPRVCKQS